MKIVLTVHQFLPEYSSGTEILTFETAKQLKRLGHDVIVFSAIPDTSQLSDEERFDQYIYEEITVYRFHHSYVPMGGQANVMELQYNNHLFSKYFKKFLIEEKPHIVHFFHFARLSASIIDVCVELGIPTVFTPTDFWIICTTSQLRLPNNQICNGPDNYGVNCLRHVVLNNELTIWSLIFRFLPDFILSFIVFLILKGLIIDKNYTPMIKALSNRRAFLIKKVNKIDRIMTPSKVMRKIFMKSNVDSKKIISIPFGLNFSHRSSIKPITIDKNILRIGFIGSVIEHKGVHILLEAVSKIDNHLLEVNIYGNVNDDPKYFERLKKIARGSSKISFLGTFPNYKVAEVLSSFDVLVIPSLWIENTPLILYSAQAAKCPVIASNVEGMSEVIEHGKNGLLFEMGSVTELKKMILALLDDRTLLRNFSENAKMPISINDYVNKLIPTYNDLIGLKKKP